jgi:glycerate dehydrogenase
MNRQKIVFLDAATYGDVPLESFRNQWDCTVHQVTTPIDVRQRLKGQTVAVTNKVPLDQAVLGSAEARDIKLIAVAATGTDIIDREAAKSLGVKVCNVPGYATHSVAQFTVGLILELASRAGPYAAAVRLGAWQKSPVFTMLDYPTVELAGRKLGIIGYGNIGRAVAKMAQGFDLEVMVAARPGSLDPVPSDRLSLDTLLATADIITLHCPLTPATQHLINERRLSLMKATAFLINTARGALVDESALIEALRNKQLAGAALDVISREPPPENHPIIEASKELENLLVTPHTAWSARQARERLLREVAANITAFFAGEPRNLVV